MAHDPIVQQSAFPHARRSSTVIYGEEGGHAYVTIKTEVTIEIRNPEEVEQTMGSTECLETEVPAWRLLAGGPFRLGPAGES